MAKYQVVHRYDGESPIFYIESSDRALLEGICQMLGKACEQQMENRVQVKPDCLEDHYTLKWQLYNYLLENEWEPLGGGFFRKA